MLMAEDCLSKNRFYFYILIVLEYCRNEKVYKKTYSFPPKASSIEIFVPVHPSSLSLSIERHNFEKIVCPKNV